MKTILNELGEPIPLTYRKKKHFVMRMIEEFYVCVKNKVNFARLYAEFDHSVSEVAMLEGESISNIGSLIALLMEKLKNPALDLL